jgi:hypothetical protein
VRRVLCAAFAVLILASQNGCGGGDNDPPVVSEEQAQKNMEMKKAKQAQFSDPNQIETQKKERREWKDPNEARRGPPGR